MCDAVELTRELVRIESTNPGAGESGIEAFVRQYLADLSIDLAVDEVLPGRNNIVATIPVSCRDELSGRLLSRLLHDKLRTVFLGHLSKENNLAELAYETVRLEISMADNPYKPDDFPIYVANRSEMSQLVEI